MLDARAAAWLGSEHLDTALARAPCGCDLERIAGEEIDPAAAEVLAAEAGRARAAWGCPYGGHEPCELGEEHRRALGTVERLTGWRGPPTCPRAALSHPLLIDALRLLPALEHGTLPTLRHLPAVLHDAAQAAAEGRGARYAFEERARERARKAAERGR